VENDYNEWELPRGLRTEDDEDEDENENDGEEESEVGVEAEYENDVESVPEEAEGLVPTNAIQV
jgi:RNA polymerase I-specific transcription initiation factor RRN3